MIRLPLLLIGVGNEYRRDDSAGILVVRRCQSVLPADVDIREASGEASTLMELWAGADRVILVDAVSSGAPAGTIHRFEAHAEPVPASHFDCSSTHAFGVAQAIELSRTLGELPRRLTVYGIEGQDFGIGGGLSPAVAQALPAVIEVIADDVTQYVH